jgi:hypothetical protein
MSPRAHLDILEKRRFHVTAGIRTLELQDRGLVAVATEIFRIIFISNNNLSYYINFYTVDVRWAAFEKSRQFFTNIFHSMLYNSVSVILTNKCAQLELDSRLYFQKL